jgi:antitoxin MazE
VNTGIRTHIVKIGNSQGIRIPKPLLEQSGINAGGINAEVEIEVEDDHLIIRAVSHPRLGWEAAFAEMAARQDDALLDEATATEWDAAEWEWR